MRVVPMEHGKLLSASTTSTLWNPRRKLLKAHNFKFRIEAQTRRTSQVGIAKPTNLTHLDVQGFDWPSPTDEIPFWKKQFPSWDVNSELPSQQTKDSKLMDIVHVTAEMAPIAKVGGLGDVVTGLARACLSRGHTVHVIGTQPDIIHVHEWQTGALPILYWDMYHYLSLKKPRIVLTIHNMEHYGECRQEQLSMCGLDGSLYATFDKAVDDRTVGHNPERLSLLKGGIVYSNAVVTVSPTYLKETLCSGWLSSTLLRNHDKYFGIVNGIDTTMWNPSTDVFLPSNFDVENSEGKKLCKYYVQRGLGLTSGDHLTDATLKVPLVVCITRLVAQKGLHLITHAIKQVEELGGQMVILGKASDHRVEREFEDLADSLNQGPSVRILLMYSEELSHLLYAAADIVLVPSMYEPCGLAQIIGMRYGAVPVVRKTGGLADTVFDIDDEPNHEMANGFVFEGIDGASLNFALDRAFACYRNKPEEWNCIVKKVMKLDNSWNITAGKYIEIYESVAAS